MSAQKLTKWLPSLKKFRTHRQPIDTAHKIFGIEDLQQEKPDNFTIEPVAFEHHEQAIRMLKDHYLSEHVFIRAHGMGFMRDNAVDQYLRSLLKQGNTVFVKNEHGTPVGICVNIASSPADPKYLRHYAHFRQDPNTKDFLNFLAKLQETPNLWEMLKVPKVFEIKMLAVVPEYRRRGLATMLAENSNELAATQGFEVVRMDCINPHDYKIAERLLFHCMGKIPLHALQARREHAHAPGGGCVRVYVGARCRDRPDADRPGQTENLIE